MTFYKHDGSGVHIHDNCDINYCHSYVIVALRQFMRMSASVFHSVTDNRCQQNILAESRKH